MRTATMLLMAIAAMNLMPAQAEADTGVTAVYQVSADQLWETVDFHQPSENIMPPIASSTRAGEGVGATKVNALQGGGEVHLLLAYYAPEEGAFNYTIQSSPLPVKNYVGVVRVTSLGDQRSELSWQGIYDPEGVSEEEADEILGGFYNAIAQKVGEIHPME
jgi:hypothetical protein